MFLFDIKRLIFKLHTPRNTIIAYYFKAMIALKENNSVFNVSVSLASLC